MDTEKGLRSAAAKRLIKGAPEEMEFPGEDWQFDIPGDTGDAMDIINEGARQSTPQQKETVTSAEQAKNVYKAIKSAQAEKARNKRLSGDAEGKGNTPENSEDPPKNEFSPEGEW